MDQLVDATIKHSDDVEYVKRLGLVLGSELSMKYFVSASDASITHFLKAYINVLNDVYNEKPYDVYAGPHRQDHFRHFLSYDQASFLMVC
jgi:hypothetical protein